MKLHKIIRNLLTATLVSAVALSSISCSSGNNNEETTTTTASPSIAFEELLSNSTSNNIAETGESDTTTPQTIEASAFTEINGYQVGALLGRQYTFAGENIPLYISDFYIMNAFMDLSGYASAGYFPATEDGHLDLSAEYSYQEGQTGPYSTFADFLLDYAERNLATCYVLYTIASNEGFEVSDDVNTAIDNIIAGIENEYAPAREVTAEEYISMYYGDNLNEETLRSCLEFNMLQDEYINNYVENYELSDEDMEAISYPYVRYALFYAPAGSDEESLSTAEANANTLFADCNGDIDAMAELADACVNAGTCMETGAISVPMGVMVPAFEAWAWDEARTEGELDVIFSQEYGYFVVGYLGVEVDTDGIRDYAYSTLNELVESTLNTEGYEFEFTYE